MKRFLIVLGTAMFCGALMLSIGFAAPAEPELKVGWSIYPGWMDNALMKLKLRKGEPSFLEERNEQYGAKVDTIKFKEYIPSVEALTAGKIDACTMTLGEALALPVDSGVPVTCILVNDYSNGNDALCVPKGWTWETLKGKAVVAEQFSVSQYLVWRGLQENKLPLNHIKFKNAPGDECAKVFLAGGDVPVATWNPHVLRIKESGKADFLFTSKSIPREIIDCVVIRNDRIKGREQAIQAYVAAHYDVMKYLKNEKTRARAIKAMVYASEMKKEDGALFDSMLEATHFYTSPKETIDFMDSKEIRTQHDRIRTFLKEFKAFRGEGVDKYQVGFDSSYIKKLPR